MSAPKLTLVGADAATSAELLCELFDGNKTHHGTYDPKRVGPVATGKKCEIKDADGRGPRTIRTGGATPVLWREHLAGGRPLGVVPIRDDGSCVWGAIDVDLYPIDLGELARKIEKSDLPLVVCRSKSGGAHLLLFSAEAMPAAAMREALRAMAELLGHPRAEVFPKQESIDPGGGHRGNWLLMPYFGGEAGEECAIKSTGLAMSIAEFLGAAEAASVRPYNLKVMTARLAAGDTKRAPAAKARAERELGECEREIAGSVEGGRNKLVFGRAKDLGRLIEAGAIEESEVSVRLLSAAVRSGLQFGEASEAIKNGIAAGRLEGPEDGPGRARRPQIERIVVTEGGEDVMWTVTLAGVGEITLPVKEVFHYYTFQLRCAEQLRVGFGAMKAAAWVAMIDVAVSVAEVRTLPPDETVAGQFFAGLRDFCLNRWRAEDDLSMLGGGKPVDVAEENRIYFRFRDLQRHFETTIGSPFRGASAQRLGRLLSGIGREGVDHDRTSKRAKGETIQARWVRRDLFEPGNSLPLPPIADDPV